MPLAAVEGLEHVQQSQGARVEQFLLLRAGEERLRHRPQMQRRHGPERPRAAQGARTPPPGRMNDPQARVVILLWASKTPH